MEGIIKAIDVIHGDMITAMAHIEVIIEAVSMGNINHGDVACSLMVLNEYIEKRADALEDIAKRKLEVERGGIPTWE